MREMAKMIGVSPTYVSKVERDEFPPPAEDKVRLIAGVIPPLTVGGLRIDLAFLALFFLTSTLMGLVP